MASQMLVPASRDTLFMRGFSSRLEIDDIRDYFVQDGGSRCTVEFFKESDDKQKLYVALKFENKDIAKELLNKYDNTEVLGDRITISWFKDLRRARLKAGGMGRRRWSPERYDNRNQNKFYTSGRYMQGSRWNNNFGTRGRKFDRSSSRSRSKSSSRSRSRSPSPRKTRSRSRSNDSHDGKRHKRHRTTSDSKKDSHKSSDKRKSSEHASRDRSSSKTRHSREKSVDRDGERSPKKTDKKSSERHERSGVKVVRSAVTTVERPVRNEAPSDDESEDSMDDYEQPMSEDEHLKENNTTTETRKVDIKSVEDKPQKETRRNHSDVIPPDEPKRVPSKERGFTEPEKTIDDGPDGKRFFSPTPRYGDSPIPLDRGPPGGSRYPTDEYTKGYNREHSRNYDRTRRSQSPPLRDIDSPPPVMRDQDRGPPGGGSMDDDYIDNNRPLQDRDGNYGVFRGQRSEARYNDDRRSDNSPAIRGRHIPASGIRSPPAQELISDVRQRPKRDFDDDDVPMYDRKVPRERDFDDMRPPIRREVLNDEFDKRQKRFLDEASIMRDSRREFYDDRGRLEGGPAGMERGPIPMDRGGPASVDRGPVAMDRGPVSMDRGPVAMDRGPVAIDRGPVAMERGLLGMDRGPVAMDRGPVTMDRGPVAMDRGQSGRLAHHQDRERSPFFDDLGSTGSGHSNRASVPQSFNGGMSREVEKGALGLPQDKMALVREKKDEVEKSYRQDCETFAAVTKMLISKDALLEDKLQASLRENLKDIGQRCIHELREYIEGLKCDDSLH